MKYKVGDRVRIKSLDWYNKNKDNYGAVYAGNGFAFWNYMAGLCGEIMTISSIKVDPEDSNKGYYFMENSEEKWTDEMIEGLVEEENEKKLSDESWRYKNIFDHSQYPQSFECPEGYIFKDENGNVINATKIVLEKKKKEYPKSYEECAKIMNCPIDGPSGWLFNFDANIKDPYYRKIDILMGKFTRLLICRDAYWKVAGEEMGLGKPWEPDWNDDEWPDMYYISWSGKYLDKEKGYPCCNMVLIFPTEEMRDAFYENFKKEIEICKEFL